MALIDEAKLVNIPSGYKAGTLYSVLPNTAAGDFDVARNSVATRVNSDIELQEMAVNVPRIQYDSGVTCPYLILEPQRTNLLTYPVSFDNAYWTKSGASIDDNGGDGYSAPSADYPTGAFKFVASSNNGYIQLTTPLTISNTTDYANSIYIKRATGTGNILIKDINNAETVISNGTAMADSWYRYDVVSTSNSTSGQIGVKLATSGDEVYIFAAQPEEGSYPTSWIYDGTEGSTTTRLADDISLATLQSSNLLGTTKGTIAIEVDAKGAVGSNKDLFLFEDTGGGDELGLRFKDDETWQWYDHHSTELIGSASTSDSCKAAISWTGTAAIISIDGTDESITLSAAFDAITDMGMGADFESAGVTKIYTSDNNLTANELNELTT